ncbi:MAG TPA: GNAT family N-acetyltransferase [Gemmatimonadaceae bacterium]|nr:GNAT family N-acetyltransferase [Gemmatimonadaceae bacterium]
MPELPPVTIRPLTSQADLAACVALQHLTWGEPFAELVPPAILKVTQRLGGVAAGAFADDGALLGFVFGLTGVERGRIVHWSDMLAVRPEWRDHGLGRRLKAWQRDAAAAAGAEVMYWTYDPLVARNAHVNFNRLGVRAHEYVRDMYGESDSPLHRGLGTDRLVVAWPLREAPAASACPAGCVGELPPTLRNAPTIGDVLPAAADGPAPDAVRIAIPLEIHAVLAADPSAAAVWRARTRAAFEWALGRGYGVAGVCRDAEAGRACYVLRRDGSR